MRIVASSGRSRLFFLKTNRLMWRLRWNYCQSIWIYSVWSVLRSHIKVAFILYYLNNFDFVTQFTNTILCTLYIVCKYLNTYYFSRTDAHGRRTITLTSVLLLYFMIHWAVILLDRNDGKNSNFSNWRRKIFVALLHKPQSKIYKCL